MVVMSRALAGLALIVPIGLSGGSASAQQNLGNQVYVCDGAAQAGPCQPDEGDGGDRGRSGKKSGYTDNDYAHAAPTGVRPYFVAVAVGQTSGKDKAYTLGRTSSGGSERFTQAHADAEAMRSCQDLYTGCKVILRAGNSSFAVFAGKSGKRYAAAVPNSDGYLEYRNPANQAKDEAAAAAKTLTLCEQAEGKGQCSRSEAGTEGFGPRYD